MPKTPTVKVVPHHDPTCLLVLWGDGHSAIVGRDEAAQFAAELLRRVPPARAAAVAREVLARPEVHRAETELTTARLLADLESDDTTDPAGLAWEVAAEQATPEQRAIGERIAERQASERAAVAGLFGPDGEPRGGRG